MCTSWMPIGNSPRISLQKQNMIQIQKIQHDLAILYTANDFCPYLIGGKFLIAAKNTLLENSQLIDIDLTGDATKKNTEKENERLSRKSTSSKLVINRH